MSFSIEFDTIARAREQDDPLLSQGEWETELKVADWPEVVNQCSDLLQNRTKDIRVAVWLAEGLTHTHGYGGLAQGCEVITGLLDTYWDVLFPLADAGDQELRLGAITRLVNCSIQLIRRIPLTQGGGAAYSCADYDAAHQFEAAANKDSDLRSRVPEHKVTLAKFTASQQKTPRIFYEQLHIDFAAARAAWKTLADRVDQRFGMDGPSFAHVFDAFDQAGRVAQRLIKEAGVLIETELPADSTPADERVPDTANSVPGANSYISNRQQALQQLERVADFFRRTEPHSPVAYLASKAVQWANMPLHEWLRTVIKDSGSLAHLEELLGTQAEGADHAKG